MLNLTFKAAQGQFFDRQKVLREMDRATARSLSKAGAFVRQRARTSIRKPRRSTLADFTPERREGWDRLVAVRRREGKAPPRLPFAASKPGEPPRTPTGTLRRSILFVYDRASKSVVIGPVDLRKGTEAPRTLERGGDAVIVRRVQGRPERRRVTIAPRPFMAPALEAEVDAGSIAEQFRNSIRSG